ncbi:MAG: hypothetical protein HGA61_00650 [Candidatus Moranbacteria bacterium]|nr:hypothetical protein [Candidatus Moranbacteria bacterium]
METNEAECFVVFYSTPDCRKADWRFSGQALPTGAMPAYVEDIWGQKTAIWSTCDHEPIASKIEEARAAMIKADPARYKYVQETKAQHGSVPLSLYDEG